VRPSRDPNLKPVESYIARRAGVPALKDVKVEACPDCAHDVDAAAKAAGKDAARLASAAKVELRDVEDAPKFLGRAASLIRRAGSLLESPSCPNGAEKTEGLAALRKAVNAYNAARNAYQEGADANIELAKRLRTIAEEVALAAARVSKACASEPTSPKPRGRKQGAWTRFVHDDDMPKTSSKPIPAAAQAEVNWLSGRVPELGGAALTTRAFHEWPAGSIVVMENDGQGFYIRGPVTGEAPKGDKAPKAPKAPKASKDEKEAQIGLAFQGAIRNLAAELRAGAP